MTTLLEQAAGEGEVRVKWRDGQIYVIKPEARTDSPLDVPKVNLGITTADIAQFIQERRKI